MKYRLYGFEKNTCSFRYPQKSVCSSVQARPAISVTQDEFDNPDSFHVRLLTRDFTPWYWFADNSLQK